MKLNHYPETDLLYIDLSIQPSAESREVSEASCSTTIRKATWSALTSTMQVASWICPRSLRPTFLTVRAPSCWQLTVAV